MATVTEKFGALKAKLRTFWNRPYIGVTYSGFPNITWYDRFLQKLMGHWGLVPLAVIFLLRPFVRIRLGLFHAQRIGHLTIDCELYLIEKKKRKFSWPPKVDFFYFYPPYCNDQIVRMYRRLMPNRKWVAALYFCNRRFFGETRWAGLWTEGRDKFGSHDLSRQLCCNPRIVNFTEEEKKLGHREMRRIGLSPDQPFVLFHNRDPAYLKSWASWDTSYHDYRDCSIESFVPSMEMATRWGYKAVRYGFRMSDRLDSANPDVIEYGSDFRTDFLDIWLMDQCRYFVGNTAGPIILANVLRKPSVCTNYIPLKIIHRWNASEDTDLIVPKRIFSEDKGRLLTLREAVEAGFHGLLFAEKYAENRLRPVENTAEEIADAVDEMEQRLNRTWITQPEDDELQRRFWTILGEPPDYVWACRVATGFLGRNPDFLD